MKAVLQFISEGSVVQRYHTRPGIRPDTDGAHSFGVSMLCSLLAGKGPDGRTDASCTLIMAGLTHDLGEQRASDVSAPAKRLLGIRDQLHAVEAEALQIYDLDYEQHLTTTEAVILKLADCFDGMLYCCRELALGNRNVMLIWRRFCSYALQISSDESLPIEVGLRASCMFESIKEIYHEVTSPSGPEFDVFAGTSSQR